MATIERPAGICEECFSSAAQSGVMSFPNLNEHLLLAHCPHTQTGAIGIQVEENKTHWQEQAPITQAEFLGPLEKALAEVKRSLDASKHKDEQ